MTTRNTRKRAREDPGSPSTSVLATGEAPQQIDSNGGPPEARKRDETFWFEDGNAIFVARDIEFRVFKGIMAKCSPVFKDMFSLPQARPSSQGLSTDGTGDCPIVVVHDAPEDFRELLRVCIPSIGVSPFYPDHPSYDTVSAIIRMGHKYQIPDLVEQTVFYLRGYFTGDMGVWAEGFPTHLPPTFGEMQAIGVVNLARLTGELLMLPTALLLCCQLGSDIVQGFPCANGLREHLALDDIGRCFAARTTLLRQSFRIALRVYAPQIAHGCTNKPDCRRVLMHFSAALEGVADDINANDVFEPYVNLYPTLHPLCAACQAMVRMRDVAERKALWNRLPAIFGIAVDGWDGAARGAVPVQGAA